MKEIEMKLDGGETGPNNRLGLTMGHAHDVTITIDEMSEEVQRVLTETFGTADLEYKTQCEVRWWSTEEEQYWEVTLGLGPAGGDPAPK